MRILLTGATGYIGTQLSRRMAQTGWTVEHVRRGCSFGNLVDQMHRYQPDVVFHLAAYVIGPHETEDVDRLIESNLAFGTRLLEAMKVCGIRKLVNTGTALQHLGEGSDDPATLYAATKNAFDEILKYFVLAEKFKVINLKLFNIYGERDSSSRLLPLIIRSLGTDDIIKLTAGEQIIDLVHIADVLSAYIVAGERMFGYSGETGRLENYGVSGADRTTIKELVLILERLANRKAPIAWGALPYRNREVMTPWTSFEPLPGWTPRISLVDGLRSVLEAELK